MEKRNDAGFLQHYQNPLIDRIQFKFDGSCTICFKDGSTADHFVGCEVVYNEQFGIPISQDGKLLFVSSWEKGLTAYDTIEGKKLWHFRSTRIANVFTYPHFLVAFRYNRALLKIDMSSGALLQELKSGSLEHARRLDDRYFFADRFRGKYCVMDAMTMETVKTYSSKVVNPSNCWSHVIRDAFLRDGRLYIEGFEDYPNRNHTVSCQQDFEREIDSDFYGNLNA